MAEVIIAARYYQFMKWFKNNHPRLYTRYGLQIRVPKHNSLIQAAMDYVEPSDKKELQEVIDAYNNAGLF